MTVLYFQIFFSAALLVIAGIPFLQRLRESWAGAGLSGAAGGILPKGNDRRYREIFENGIDGIFVIEVLSPGKYRFESLNPAASQILSPQGVELAGCAFDRFSGQSWTPQGGFLEELQRRLSPSLAGGMPAQYECLMGRAAEEARHLQVKLVPMADDSGIGHVLVFLHDITARKRHEQELLQRVALEERLSGFAASAPGFFFTYRHGADGSNAMPFASAGIGDLFGLLPENVALSIAPINLLIHPDDQKSFIDTLVRSAVELTPFDVEFRVNHPHRGELWVEARATPQGQADGSIVWHGFMYDITRDKALRLELQRREAEFRALVENSSDPIFRYDCEGRRIYVNPVVERISGVPASMLLGCSSDDGRLVSGSDGLGVKKLVREVVETGEKREIEVAHVSADGHKYYFHNTFVPEKDAGGRVVGVLSVARDITGRKQVETDLVESRSRLEEAQRLGKMGSWELDLAGRKLYWSDEIYRIFEIDPERFGASYEAFLNAVHPEDRAMVDMAYQDSLASRKPYSIDHRLLFSDGRVKHVRESCETYYDENGQPLRSHGTVQDITQLKETELALIETQRKLRELMLSREEVLEEERKRIAWELNEELAQQLFAIKMRLYGLRSRIVGADSSLDGDMRGISEMADKSVKTVTSLVACLRPTVLMHGVGAALEWLAAEIGGQHGIPFDIEIDDGSIQDGEELTTQVFRVAQEILAWLVRNEEMSHIAIAWSSADGKSCLRIEYEMTGLSGSIERGTPDWFAVRERVAVFGGAMQVGDASEGRSRIEVVFPVGSLAESQYLLFSV